MLAKSLANQKQWDQVLQAVTFQYNVSKHEVTKYSPYELHFGRKSLTPVDLQLVKERSQSVTVEKFADILQKKMTAIFKRVKRLSVRAAEKRKKRYDYKVFERHYKSGDLVMLKVMQFGQNVFRKWARKYTGPYTIVRQTGPVNYQIRDSKKTKRFVVHIDRLKPAAKVSVRHSKVSTEKVSGKGTQCIQMVPRAYEKSAIDGGQQLPQSAGAPAQALQQDRPVNGPSGVSVGEQLNEAGERAQRAQRLSEPRHRGQVKPGSACQTPEA
jgi:hypothetical protein